MRIQRLICQNRLEQFKLTFALWTRGAVMLLVKQELGIELPIRTMVEYLKRWGFTPQKPITRAYEQHHEAVKAWLDDHKYPAIAQRAKIEEAEIHWGDEIAVVNTDVRGRGYQPKGQTPVAYTVGGHRHKLSMISTVTNQGKGALDDRGRSLQQRQANRIFGRPDQGCGSKNLPDSGQPSGASQQTC